VSVPSVATARLAATAAASLRSSRLAPARCRPIAHGPISRILIRRAHGELIAIHLAEEHRTGRIEFRYDGRVIRRLIALKDLRSRGSRCALHHEHVFDANRNSGQRGQWIALCCQSVNPIGLRKCALFGQAEECVQMRIDALDALVIRGGQIGCPGGAGDNSRAQFRQRFRRLKVRRSRVPSLGNSIFLPEPPSGARL